MPAAVMRLYISTSSFTHWHRLPTVQRRAVVTQRRKIDGVGPCDQRLSYITNKPTVHASLLAKTSATRQHFATVYTQRSMQTIDRRARCSRSKPKQ